MNNFHTFLKKTGLMATALLLGLPAWAQTELPEGTSPLIVAPHQQTTSYRERTICYDITANVSYDVTTESSWVKVRKGNNGEVYVHLDQNFTPDARTAQVVFSNDEYGLSETLTLTQTRDESAEYVPGEDDPEWAIFGDDMLTTLREGVTQADVDALQNPFIKSLATQLYENTYSLDYRYATYEAYLDPNVLSAQWATPGKLYNQLEGVTGINITKGKHAVVVSGIPDGVSVRLAVVAWYIGKVSGNFDGGNPEQTDYQLHNGMNVIEYNGDYDGLAYVCYYTQDDPEQYSDIKVHFVNEQVNGYLSTDKTNEEMWALCDAAPNYCMDVVGKKAHSVWTAKGVPGYEGGLRDYCKASDGTSLGYIQYINLLDTLVAWEHELLGFYKYNRVPKNSTFAYVNFTYYMFQGGRGVSFHVDQESRVLNCRRLMYNDDDAIWGLSHEWGHQHQMQPYFCWAGCGESTNNMNSCYNVLHMGYPGTRVADRWNAAYNTFRANTSKTYKTTYIGDGVAYPERLNAYKNIDSWSWSPAIQDSIRAQAELFYDEDADVWNIPSIDDDPEHAISAYEIRNDGETGIQVEQHLAPYFQLYIYFSNPENADDYLKDYQQDVYEALRQTDNENGSVIEPVWENGSVTGHKSTVDKYELLASAQNGVAGKYDEFKQKYPNSVWLTKGYLPESGANWSQNSVPSIFNYIRKASQICGYNLFDFFDAMGQLRNVYMVIGDYGNKNIFLTADMKQEFKEDMEALDLKPMTPELIEKLCRIPNGDINNAPWAGEFSTPDISNEPDAE